MENWAVYLVYKHSGQSMLFKDGFNSEDEAEEYEKNMDYDRFDEFAIIEKI